MTRLRQFVLAVGGGVKAFLLAPAQHLEPFPVVRMSSGSRGVAAIGAPSRYGLIVQPLPGSGSELLASGVDLTVGRLIASCGLLPQRRTMAKPSSRRRRPLPLMMAELMMASWETIARRSVMMAKGTCSPAEYRRMAMEKAAAMQLSALAVVGGRGKRQALAPWHKRATANAKRLRRGKT